MVYSRICALLLRNTYSQLDDIENAIKNSTKTAVDIQCIISKVSYMGQYAD